MASIRDVQPPPYLNGLVHSYYKNHIYITSPNVSYVPEFPELNDTGIYLRGDGFYGPQEFTRWPQIYTHSLCHYSVIPTEPKDKSGRFWNSVLFRKITKDDWIPLVEPPAVNDMNWHLIEFAGGVLRKTLVNPLSDALEQAIACVMAGHENDNNKAYALGRALRNLGRSAINRLRVAPDCASQVIFTARDVQRIALELHGIHEWMTVIRHRLGTKNTYPPGQYLGCFTSKVAEAEMLYNAGIPVWYIRHVSSNLPSHNLGVEVQMIPIFNTLEEERWLCVNKSYLYSPKITDGGRIRDCTGLVYDEALREMMEIMKSYSIYDLQKRVGGDLVEESGDSSVSNVGSDNKRKSTNHDVSTPAQTKKKAKGDGQSSLPPVEFYIDGCTDAPSLTSACKEAMLACAPLGRPPPGKGARYFFPPPWLICHKKEDLRDRYVHNYIRIREYCLRRHYSEDFGELPWRTEFWKEAIKGNYKQSVGLTETTPQALKSKNDTLPPSTATSGSSKRPGRKFFRLSARTEFGCNGELQPWNPGMVVTWKGKQLHVTDISSQIREEVQFEVYELNWRAELLALDLEVSPNPEGAVDHVARRKELVGRVWNMNSTGVMDFPDYTTDYFLVRAGSHGDTERSVESLTNLLILMSDWPDFPASLQNVSFASLSAIHLHRINKDIFRFYTKTFYAHFYRLPILPRLLPEAIQK